MRRAARCRKRLPPIGPRRSAKRPSFNCRGAPCVCCHRITRLARRRMRRARLATRSSRRSRMLVHTEESDMSTLHVPYVIERSPRGERSYDIFSRLLMDRIIFLGSEVNDDVANILIAQLLFL